tara:strand:+ start:247 stop:663 length:417 start_codon:yes stop_codon:yes gene_type:complete
MVNFQKIIELVTINEIKTDMDLNVAAELLDNINKNTKEKVMPKPKKTKTLFNMPKYFYSTTSFIFTMGAIFFLIINKMSDKLDVVTIEQKAITEEVVLEQEEQSEWIISEQISEYELGMNTVEYFEDMMPRVIMKKYN